MELNRFGNFVWWWLTNGAEEAEVTKFKNQLWQPPAGVVPDRGPWSPEAETNAFMSLKAGMSGKK